MKRLIWIVAWISVAVWSLFAWGAYGLIDVFGNMAAGNADVVSNPEAVEWLSWSLRVLRGLGLAAVIGVWAFVSLVILAVAWVLARLVGRREHPAMVTGYRPTTTHLDHRPNGPGRPDSATHTRGLDRR